jgi:hypothetical protein
VLKLVEAPVEFVDTRDNKRQSKVHLRPSNAVLGVPFGDPTKLLSRSAEALLNYSAIVA